MRPDLLATTDVLAVEVTVVATLVVVALVAAIVWLLKSVRVLRRQADALAYEAEQLLDELGQTVRQAGAEVERVGRIVGSAEAISDAVGSASRLAGGVVTEPLIKLVAFGSGVARVARVIRGGGGGTREIPAVAHDNRRRQPSAGAQPGPRARGAAQGRRSRPLRGSRVGAPGPAPDRTVARGRRR